jgi:hypothetical protein
MRRLLFERSRRANSARTPVIAQLAELCVPPKRIIPEAIARQYVILVVGLTNFSPKQNSLVERMLCAGI